MFLPNDPNKPRNQMIPTNREKKAKEATEEKMVTEKIEGKLKISVEKRDNNLKDILLTAEDETSKEALKDLMSLVKDIDGIFLTVKDGMPIYEVKITVSSKEEEEEENKQKQMALWLHPPDIDGVF